MMILRFQFALYLNGFVDAILHRPRELLIIALVVVSLLITPLWNLLKRKFIAYKVHSWTAIPATIDIVTVVEREEQESRSRFSFYQSTSVYYVAVLTYFYRLPELETGEYERKFDLDTAAQHWADQFKGRQVMVQVNPKDPSESYLLDDEVERAASLPKLSDEDVLKLVKAPKLSQSLRFTCMIVQMLSMLGLAVSLVMVGAILAGLPVQQQIPVWPADILIGILAATTWIVCYRADVDSYKSFWSGYTLWCPEWMRWSVRIAGFFFLIVWASDRFFGALPAAIQLWLFTHLQLQLNLFNAFLFVALTAVHTALLRSQENLRGVSEEIVD